MTTITYGAFSFDSEAIPTASRDALLREGFVHYLGNRVASRVAAAMEKAKRGEPATETTPAVPGRDLTDAEKVELTARYRTETMNAIAEGTLGVRAVGEPRAPKVSTDPVDVQVLALAKIEVDAIITSNGFTVKKDTIYFSNGEEKPYKATIAAFAKAKDGVLRPRAEKIVAAARANAAKAEPAAPGADPFAF